MVFTNRFYVNKPNKQSRKVDGFFLSCRNSENECFELIIDFGVKTDALSFKNIHNFARFTDFVKIKIKI